MKLVKLITAGIAAAGLALSAHAAGGAKHPHSPEGGWSFEGPLGKFDKASVQRGYQVYVEVCASCHSMDLVSCRNRAEKGGPFYDSEYAPNDHPLIKAFAEQYNYEEIDDVGDVVTRPGRPSDPFKNPYPNPAAARASNGGALPPDLSVIVKARSGGADYIYSLLVGYPEVTTEDRSITIRDAENPKYGGVLTQAPGLYYNPYFPGDTKPNWSGDPRHAPYGGFLAMAPQLVEGRVEYQDGTVATVEQMAKDVTTFLAWASEPHQDAHKSSGIAVILFLLVLAVLLWFSYQRIWRNVEH